MPTYLSPGVYVEEVEAGSRPIEGVGTAVAAFVGLTEKGPLNTPTLVTNWSQFKQTFGEFVEGSYLAHSVYGYFMNGGGSCYIVRVGGNGAAPTARAELPGGAEGKIGAYRVTALESALGGDGLAIEIADPGEGATEDQFKVLVRRGSKVVEEYDKVTTKKGR